MGLTAILFPGQGSQTDEMCDVVERSRPELLGLAVKDVELVNA
jgi:malonyl CoA-acyl carrier protein transacylase